MNQDVRSHQFKEAFLAAFPYAIPVMTSFIILGIAYGVLMQTKGYGTLWSVLMSAIAFCGSMQFFAITLLTVPFNPIQAFLLSLMVNARHLFYGISMLEKYNNLGKIRFFLIYTLCDETFSIASSAPCPCKSTVAIFTSASLPFIIVPGYSVRSAAAWQGNALPLILRDWIFL